MDCIEAILARRSCRAFSGKKVEKEKIIKMLECATYAPSPANKQPWEFIVVSDKPQYNEKLQSVVEKAIAKASQRSDWSWLPKFKVNFLTQAPTLIVVVGDPSRNGAEQFLDEPSQGYEQACSAAIQNILLAAESQGVATLWFSLFEKSDVREIFQITSDKDPLAVICVGYSEKELQAPPRKAVESKVKFL